MNELTITQMAQATARHLSKEDALLVAAMALKHTRPFAVLLSAHAGQEMKGAQFAALALGIAKRLHVEGTDAS